MSTINAARGRVLMSTINDARGRVLNLDSAQIKATFDLAPLMV